MRQRRVPLLLLDQFIADQKMAAQQRDPDGKSQIGRQIGDRLGFTALAACRWRVVRMLGDHDMRNRAMAVSVVKPGRARPADASAGSTLAAMAPLPATTKAPTPSQILVFVFIAYAGPPAAQHPAPP